MNSRRDPAELSESERLREITGILATGILRLREIRQLSRPGPSPPPAQRSAKSRGDRLDVRRKTVLSVRNGLTAAEAK